jgi:hypothetical protein
MDIGYNRLTQRQDLSTPKLNAHVRILKKEKKKKERERKRSRDYNQVHQVR